MKKVNEVIELIKKVCDTEFSIKDLGNLNVDVDEKKELVAMYDIARSTLQLDRMKEIIKKVEKGMTLYQGNNH